MSTLKNKLYLCDDFAQHFNFVYANTHELRREAYQLRSHAYNTSHNYSNNQRHEPTLNNTPVLPPKSTFEQAKLDIDPYDAHSHHLLLQNKDTHEFAACVRIIEASAQQSNQCLPFEQCQKDIWVSSTPIEKLSRHAFSEMSRLTISEAYLQQKGRYNDEAKITLGLCLAAYSLARLLFHDYMFAELSLKTFKKLRVAGLLFEQATDHMTDTNSQEQKSIFYINLETGINAANPVYELQQHILNEVAHQLNIPLVHHTDSSETDDQSKLSGTERSA